MTKKKNEIGFRLLHVREKHWLQNISLSIIGSLNAALYIYLYIRTSGSKALVLLVFNKCNRIGSFVCIYMCNIKETVQLLCQRPRRIYIYICIHDVVCIHTPD